jgi:hypothetical protein
MHRWQVTALLLPSALVLAAAPAEEPVSSQDDWERTESGSPNGVDRPMVGPHRGWNVRLRLLTATRFAGPQKRLILKAVQISGGSRGLRPLLCGKALNL